ncbi:MAG TPA: hypothetical protein VIX73_37315 [Kofleriaceae bacterium]|jgi:hypothetical protein
MSSLVELLAKEPMRQHVIEDCVELIEAQVKTKGFIIKSAYATIKAIKKRFIPEVVDTMLDEWLGKLQPHYERWSTNKTSSFADYVVARGDVVAEDLLSVTDARAERTSHTTAKKMYSRMRDGAKKNVIEAIPALGKMIEKHLASVPKQPSATA